MSGSQGSPYGLGAYGKGPYGQATRILGIYGASRGTLRPQLWAQAMVPIFDATTMQFEGGPMWARIVPDCDEDWGVISAPWQALPNSAGNMFSPATG